MATILWTYIPKEIEEELRCLAEEIESRGHFLFIVYHSSSETLKKWKINSFPSEINCEKSLNSYDELCVDRWGDRIYHWGHFKGQNSKKVIYSLTQYYENMLDCIKPDVVVIWNPMAYIYGILGDVAKKKGINCFYSERGIVSPGFFIDKDGVLGLSSVRKLTREDYFSPENEVLGELYIENIDTSTLSLYKQSKVLDRELKSAGEKKVLILGSHEMQAGIFPPELEDRKHVLPFFSSNEEMVHFILKNFTDVLVIFKPHPHCNANIAKISDNQKLVVSNVDPNLLIEISDLVIANGSKLELNVILKDTPLILPGFGLLWNKGCSWEARSKEEFSLYIRECLKEKKVKDEQLKALAMYVGFTIKNQFFLKEPIELNDNKVININVAENADKLLDSLDLPRTGSGVLDMATFFYFRDQVFDNKLVYSSVEEFLLCKTPIFYRLLQFLSPRKYFMKLKKIILKLVGP